MIKKYTANYAYINPNFVIQNLVSGNMALEQGHWVRFANEFDGNAFI